ncbi:hypothetical protein ACLGIH_07795 [Streptomyces sp. HMX87]|uniref:hypothetical protein n=1 Tax=Streptomyces sp. HMX87 TaxID=3390849 RepID=UPI003A862A7A
MTKTSIAIVITDQTGAYGRNTNWATRLSAARTMPVKRGGRSVTGAIDGTGGV